MSIGEGAADKPVLPPGQSYARVTDEIAGIPVHYPARRNWWIGFGLSVMLLLLFLYERFRVAGAIMLISVLTMAAVFIGLHWTGTELNISSMMGMVMIVGNVTEVAIFYYSEYVDFMKVGSPEDRLIAAGIHRLRAIVMTTLAAILALLPLRLRR